jgi:hypothetical protein
MSDLPPSPQSPGDIEGLFSAAPVMEFTTKDKASNIWHSERII